MEYLIPKYTSIPDYAADFVEIVLWKAAIDVIFLAEVHF